MKHFKHITERIINGFVMAVDEYIMYYDENPIWTYDTEYITLLRNAIQNHEYEKVYILDDNSGIVQVLRMEWYKLIDELKTHVGM